MYYLILALLVFFLLIQIIAAIKKGGSKEDYRRTFSDAVNPVEFRMADELKSRGYKVTDFSRMINDRGQGIVFAYDSNKDFMAVGMADSTVMGRGSELKDVEKIYVPSENGKKYLSASIRFTLEDVTYTYEIATKPFNPKGMVGKIAYEITEDFHKDLLMVLNKERN